MIEKKIIMQYKTVKDGVFRVFAGDEDSGMLSRYGFIEEGEESRLCDGKNSRAGAYSLWADGGEITVYGGRRELKISAKQLDAGFEIQIPLTEADRLYGLGNSECCGDQIDKKSLVMRRGTTVDMCIRNFKAYGPIPYLMSADGWGIFVNCTYNHRYDMGETDKNLLKITASKGILDFYILEAESMKKLLALYTDLTGKPVILPKFAYGFLFDQNEQTDTRSLLWDTKSMRERDIPCDIMNLEPTWAEVHYDETVDKKWNKERFYLPHWRPENQSGKDTFFFNLREMGMQLSLWLCENYDLLWEEDKRVFEDKKYEADASGIQDANLIASIFIDKITKQGEAWFEHLKKFVDNGVCGFKLDGCTHISGHPDRLWGGQYTDDEVHNVYPVILAKQTFEGFVNHTGRRPFLYIPGIYAGMQKYAATWAGDIGAGQRTVPSIFNCAMCGHTNTSADMEVHDAKSVHYVFLLPWTEQNGWATWQYPWFLSEEREQTIREYSKLRSSLFPYIYSMAHIAAETGLPIARPLPLVYEDTDRFDETLNMYMLGDSLLVGIFDMHMDLPDGVWIDYFTGKEYSGKIDYEIPKGRGGALFVKKGTVFVTMEPQKYILEKEHDYRIEVFPGNADEFTLYEDDGFTFDYLQGKIAKTKIMLSESDEKGFRITVKKREGDFEGRPDNGHDHFNNSIPKIDGIKPVRDMRIILHTENISEITMGCQKVEFERTDQGLEFILPAAVHASDDVVIAVSF